jgi:hypothetical protein
MRAMAYLLVGVCWVGIRAYQDDYPDTHRYLIAYAFNVVDFDGTLLMPPMLPHVPTNTLMVQPGRME